MNTLFAVLVMTQGDHAAAAEAAAVPAAAESLSPEKHLCIRLPSTTGPYNDEATTPEASTDSDNDSAFESESEPCGGKRGLVSILGTPKTTPKSSRLEGPCRWRCNQASPSQQQHLDQPLPRKVRFKIDRTQYRQSWDGVEDRRTAATAVQENALLALGTMSCAQQRALVQAQNKHESKARVRLATTKRPVATIVSPVSNGGGGVGAVRWTGVACKKRAMSPFKDADINPRRRPSAPAANRHLRRQSITSGATTTATTTINSTPASPKKRNVPSVATMLRLRARGNGNGSGSSRFPAVVAGRKHNRRPSRLTKGTAATTVPAAPPAETRREAAQSASPPASSAMLDLSCKEAVDMDAVMRPGGEVRTPICRFLLPCWPEGVEGYEEVGGWRRLGGPTRETFPRGRRCS